MPRKKTSVEKPEQNLESLLQELTERVTTMEKGALPLEEALKQFEAGVGLVRQCQKVLQTAEQKIQILMQESDNHVLKPLTENTATILSDE